MTHSIRITLYSIILTTLAHAADLVVFSYNRPLQLYAFLESLERYTTGLNHTTIIYRADDNNFEKGYEIVKERFYVYDYKKQGSDPKADFKPLTIESSYFSDTESPYILYAVDDIIVKDYIDLKECALLLEKHNGYAFYLRLGRHLSYCYSLNQDQPLPPGIMTEPNVFKWIFYDGSGDWGYPHSVDMTLIRKKDIYHHYINMPYHAPNILEGRWSCYAGPIMSRYGICYTETKIVNIPLNRVQNDYFNRHMAAYTPQELLDIFLSGKKIDITPLYKMSNPSAHTEYTPTFIER